MPRCTAWLLSLSTALLLLAVPAFAQYGSSGYGNPALQVSSSPPFTQADIRIMDSILGLTPEQRELTDALFQEFFGRYRQAATEVRLEIEALVEEAAITQKEQPLHDGSAIVAEWTKRRDAMRVQFVEDLRLLMDQHQIQFWPKVERELRRKDQIGDGRIAGESIDLIRLIDAHIDGWQENSELVAELDRYAERMDRALVARSKLITSDEGREFYSLQTSDPDAALRLHAEALELRTKVLRINTDALDRLGAYLSTEQHTVIRHAFYQQATERAIPESPIAHRIAAARALPSLTATQRERMAPVLNRYDDTSLATERAMFEALSQTQMDIVPARLYIELQHRAEGDERVDHRDLEQPQPLLDKALKDRLDRERAAWSAIRPILTASQLAELPKLDMDTIWFPQIAWFGL